MTLKLEDYTSHPTKFKEILIKKHKIPVKTVSNYIGLSKNYVYDLLNGRQPISKKIENKLQELVRQLEGWF